MGRTMRIGAAALGGVLFAGGCQWVAGVQDPLPYPPDGGGGGGQGGSTTTDGGGGAGGVCAPESKLACAYTGAKATEGVGICHAGEKVCDAKGAGYGECTGEVTPKAESCADPADENCDGYDCVQWAQLFGGAADQYTTDVAVDAMGNSYVVGYFEGTIPFNGKTLIDVGSGDGFILKFDPAGKPIWGQQFGDGDFQLINTLAIDSAGNVLFGGRSVSPISLGGLERRTG
jgi:hypothetical protein